MILPPIVLVALLLPAVIILGWIVTEFRNSRAPYSIKRTRKYGKGFSDLLVYAALVKPDVVLNKDGALMAAFEFVGDDPTTLDHGTLRRRIAHLNQMFLGRDKGWMFHFDLIRRPAAPLTVPRYIRSAEERVLAEERVECAGDRFTNRCLMAVTYLPSADAVTKRSNLILDGDTPIEVSIERVYETFTRGLREIEDFLSPIATVRRLSETRTEDADGNVVVQNEILAALVDVIYGDEQAITVPARTPVMLASLLGAQDMICGYKPRIGGKHIAVLNLGGFPPASYPGMLSALQRVNVPFRFSTRIIVEDTTKARKKLDEAYRTWFGKRTSLATKALGQSGGRVNRDADRMADDAESALEALDRGLVKYVYYTGKAVLLCDDVVQLEAAKRELLKTFKTAGFIARDETLNAIDAYLGSLWGDGYHDLRKYMLHSLNAGDALISTGEWGGRKKITCEMCPPNVEPMAIVRTQGRGDFSFDVHYRDVMHVLAVGATSAGKTTLINFLAGNFTRAPEDQFFGLDFGYGMYTPCRFFDGEHVDPRGPGDAIRFPLFAHLGEPGENAWVADLLVTICELNGVRITPRQREIVETTLRLFERTPREDRSLSTFLPKLNDGSGELRMALQPYTAGGSLDGILDGDGDALRGAAYTVFELSNVAGGDNKDRVLVPVMMVIFRIIQRRLGSGRRTFVAIDEAWSQFKSPAALPKLEEALRTFRKLHAGVGLFTQNLDDIVGTSLATTVIGACKTQILLPNEHAATTFSDFYRALGRGPQEIAAIARATQKRDYYFVGDDGAAMIDLNLSPAELAIYARGSIESLEEVRRMANQYPDTWREEILRARGCTRAADRLAELRASGTTQPRHIRRELAIA